MSFYKITFACEERAIGDMLSRLSEGVRAGLVSPSFIVEREEESAAEPAEPRTPAAIVHHGRPKGSKNKRRGRVSHDGPSAHRVLIDYLEAHGGSAPSRELKAAIVAAGFAPNSYGGALKNARKTVRLKMSGRHGTARWTIVGLPGDGWRDHAPA